MKDWLTHLRFGLLLAFCATGFPCALASDEPSAKFAVVVNAENPITKIDAEELSNFFLKKKRAWPDGTGIRFVDRTDDSPERKHFLRSVVKKTGREVDLFWIGQKLYTGDSAPIQVTSDSLTASLIARFRGGIGYVSPDFTGAPGVKKIEVVP
ncbi:MAG: hypothetical protein AB7P04_11955 [Bacteriovoracia bacterium]